LIYKQSSSDTLAAGAAAAIGGAAVEVIGTGETMRIWDIHCHPQDPRIPGRNLAERVETLIDVADRMGIERIGLFLRLHNQEKEVHDVLVRRRDKVFGFLWMRLWNDTIASTH
jgi:hypothetical protein